MKVDDLYMENLTEYVFDEKQFVTYKYLSIKLGVHVNLAKQMLYHFYDTRKSEGKKIYAMYYLSGMAPQRWISGIGVKKEDEELQSQDSLYSQDFDKDAYLVLLCKDSELEQFKKKFSQLYSVHVYGLSSFVLDSFDVLNQAVEKPLRDDDGNAPVHFGPITCKAAFEYRENPVIAPLLKNVQEVKANLVKAKEKHEKEKQQKPEEVSKPVERHEPSVSPSKGKASTKTTKKASSSSNNSGSNRLRNMFAVAASSSKLKPKVVEEPKAPVVVIQDSGSSDEKEENTRKASSKRKSSGKAAQKTAKSTNRESQSRKRKRIKDVFSSSDEDEEEVKHKMSDDDEDCIPESPIPRKKAQIESDSDDDLDFKPKTPVVADPLPPEITKSGKKRVSKSIPRRHVDDEGFLVTVMEQVMVSESDQSEDEKEVSKSENKDSKSKDNKPGKMEKKTAGETSRKKESARPVSSTSNSSNSNKKQASIMSFFKKK